MFACQIASQIAIIIDNLPKLFAWTAEGEVRIVGNANQNEHLNHILNVISDNLPNVSFCEKNLPFYNYVCTVVPLQLHS